MIDVAFNWLVEQEVPLVFFIVALLTKPMTWSRLAMKAMKKRFGTSDK